MTRRAGTLLLLCCVALLATAPGASAKPGYFVFPGYRSLELNLKGSHGYRVNLQKLGRRVFLSAYKARSVAAYLTRSLDTGGSEIKAKLPGVGRISVRFRPQGPPREHRKAFFPGCKGGRTVKQEGHFVGSIRFRGERGYTSVRARRAPGFIETASKEACKRAPFEEDSEPAEGRTELLAFSRSGGGGISFSASSISILDSTPLTDFSASIVENRRGMRIFRTVFVPGKARDIVIDDPRPSPLSATVTPPAPFRGSADFERSTTGESTWTGSLKVPFPGLDPVALTGLSFTARLCQPPGCTGNTIDGHRLPSMFPLLAADRVDDHGDPEQLVLAHRIQP